jgi:hypothetical protein
MKKFSTAILVPLWALSVVPAFALSSQWNLSTDDGTTYLTSADDSAFSSESPVVNEEKDSSDPHWAAGLTGVAGRGSMMIARGVRGMHYLNNAGFLAGDAYSIAKHEDSQPVQDADFDH